jgi:hypothetical protein
MHLAALALELEQQFPPALPHMVVAQCRQAEAVVLFGVLLVADAHQSRLEQTYDGRQNRAAGEWLTPHVMVDTLANARQGAAELPHAVKLDLVARRAPIGMIAMLLAAAGVAPRGLQVPKRVERYPDARPGRWDGEMPQPIECVSIDNSSPVRIIIDKPLPGPSPGDARLVIRHVNETGLFRRLRRIDNHANRCVVHAGILFHHEAAPRPVPVLDVAAPGSSGRQTRRYTSSRWRSQFSAMHSNAGRSW